MAEPPHDLFRPEALQHYNATRSDGDLLRLSPRWLRFTYWLLVLVLVSGAAYVSGARVSDYAGGRAVVHREGGRCAVLALLPARYRGQLRTGVGLRVALDGAAARELSIAEVGPALVGANALGRELGPDLAATLGAREPGVLVRAALDGGDGAACADGLAGAAEARVGRERLVWLLLPGLKTLIERHGG